ncbi:uncharacterized protein LOC123715383 [Pieris brassicae]|uniref:uncharacterized protein LOC123715383 n=1 Tax=Pieris brassicae TaxID=7116 RepID=UPI001E65FF3D|nr:uncharacterized protein LOC123715383 [Pieris brassicae]
MSTGIFICLTVLVIQNVTAQFRVPELSPQTVPTLQNQNLQNLWSLGPLSSPTSRMKLVSQRHRYIIKKPQKKINKRQLMAELFKQSAIKNIQDAASICNRKKKSVNLNNIDVNIPLIGNDVGLNTDVYNFKYL